MTYLAGCPVRTTHPWLGDEVGHGMQAAAIVPLRTVVRALADIDLPPDEPLLHQDDVAIRPSVEISFEDLTDTASLSRRTGSSRRAVPWTGPLM